MKFIKSLIIAGSAIGIYSAIKKFRKKQKPGRVKHEPVNIEQRNNYKQLTPEQVREQFKERIAGGKWLSEEEYAAMTEAMKTR